MLGCCSVAPIRIWRRKSVTARESEVMCGGRSFRVKTAPEETRRALYTGPNEPLPTTSSTS